MYDHHYDHYDHDHDHDHHNHDNTTTTMTTTILPQVQNHLAKTIPERKNAPEYFRDRLIYIAKEARGLHKNLHLFLQIFSPCLSASPALHTVMFLKCCLPPPLIYV